MLTRDFTWSRNLSQEFAVSRSRPAWVAVVIGRERKTSVISKDVKKLWKGNPCTSLFQASGCLPAPERFLCPCRSARGPFEVVGLRTAALRPRGIVADWFARSKRKVCERIHHLSHAIHSFSTSTNIVQLRFEVPIFAVFFNIFWDEARTLHKTCATLPEVNLG